VDFKDATDTLGLPSPDLARELENELGISVSAQWVRQARLAPTSKGYRSPPEGWERVVARLARERLSELRELSALDRSEHRRERDADG
jgi:hypothetical protein